MSATKIYTERTAGTLHRSAVTAVDKLAAITITAADNATITGVMAATPHGAGVAPVNAWGSAGSSALVSVTPTLNKTVDITIPASAGAEYYDVYFSASTTAPLWVARITEEQRKGYCPVTAVATVGASTAAQQVETATAAGNVTVAGNATCTVTATGMTGSPKAVSVPVTTDDTTGALIAAKIRTALAADADVTAMFDVSGATDKVILTRKLVAGVPQANIANLNMAIATGTATGVTTAATSTDTTAGVLGGRVNVRLVGTGLAANALPATVNNAYTPLSVTPVYVGNKTTAHVYVSVAVTDLRSAPTLSIIPFVKNAVTGSYAQGAVQAVSLLTAVGKSLNQVIVIDVNGANSLVVLIDTISGQGTAVTIHVELS
jgi:hypothetical protein